MFLFLIFISSAHSCLPVFSPTTPIVVLFHLPFLVLLPIHSAIPLLKHHPIIRLHSLFEIYPSSFTATHPLYSVSRQRFRSTSSVLKIFVSFHMFVVLVLPSFVPYSLLFLPTKNKVSEKCFLSFLSLHAFVVL